ncbi:MAG: hypothetical protein PWP04_11 [Candidatus Atribacteria bacterium]|nr:hypothetical protein [Candidatus Atribacteria bacterium]
MRFENQVVLITGGASGIGRETSRRFAEEGANVLVVDKDENLGIKAVEEIIGSKYCLNNRLTFVRADVSKDQDVLCLAQKVKERYGVVDVLVNNAGVNLNEDGILEHSMKEFEETFQINLFGYIRCIRAFLSGMIYKKRGVIVNIASTMGLRGAEHSIAYTLTKGSVITLTQSLALAHAKDNVRVNAVAPGLIKTPATEGWISKQKNPAEAKGIPLGRVGLPRDVAEAILFLSSIESAYITGVVLLVDGGLTLGE